MDNAVLVFSTYPVFFFSTVFILGLTIGSFLNVVIYRLPVMLERSWQHEYQSYFNPDQAQEQPAKFNLAYPSSTCPKCGHKITALENIPIISWLVLGGKCSNCKTPIPWRYPGVELLTGLASLAVAWQFGVTEQTLFALIFMWSLIALTFIDLDKMLLPDQITLPLLWLGLIVNTQGTFTSLESAIWGAVAGYLSLWSLYWAFKLLTGKEGMGYGDFKLLAALGAWMGVATLPIIILLSSFVGAAFGISQILMQKNQKDNPIPFGPYLAIAGVIALFFGDWIMAQYWNYLLA